MSTYRKPWERRQRARLVWAAVILIALSVLASTIGLANEADTIDAYIQAGGPALSVGAE